MNAKGRPEPVFRCGMRLFAGRGLVLQDHAGKKNRGGAGFGLFANRLNERRRPNRVACEDHVRSALRLCDEAHAAALACVVDNGGLLGQEVAIGAALGALLEDDSQVGGLGGVGVREGAAEET